MFAVIRVKGGCNTCAYCRQHDSVVSTRSTLVIDVVAITMSCCSFGVPFVVQTEQELHFAQSQHKKRVQAAMYNYVPVVANVRLELAKGGVAAAQARRKYDRAESAIRRFMRQGRKVCPM